MRASSVQVLSAIEQRMKSFLESQTGTEQLPISLFLVKDLHSEIQRILKQRIVRTRYIHDTEHTSDQHSAEMCHRCQNPFQDTYQVDGPIQGFMATIRELLAELTLSG